jgi:hypothetical protein
MVFAGALRLIASCPDRSSRLKQRHEQATLSPVYCANCRAKDAQAYTPDSQWRNQAEFLIRKWVRKLGR